MLIIDATMVEGTTEYTTCTGLLTTSSTTWPNTALFQIAASGVTLDKLVIGKPATTADANNGYMNTTLLAQCVGEAAQQGWGTFNSYMLINGGLINISRCWRHGLGSKLSKPVC
jgi:hypothetical protein